MPSQDLVAAVDSHLSQGESPDEVKKFLLNEGWAESAIDQVFADKSKKQPSIWELMPFYQSFLRLDKKYATLSWKVVLGISVGLIFFVILFAFILYQATDPFNSNGASRDLERDAIYEQLLTGLRRYYDNNHVYPASLSELVPDYITHVPHDPKSDKPYDYQPEGMDSFKLCIYFETKPQPADCIGKESVE